MGNSLVIPGANFSKNKIRTVRTEKIFLDDENDMICGAPQYGGTNNSILTMNYGSNDSLPSTYAAFSKLDSNIIAEASSSWAHGLKTYIVDIPENAIAVGGLFQMMVNRSQSTLIGNHLYSFASRSTIMETTENGAPFNCFIATSRSAVGYSSNDDFETIFNKIVTYNLNRPTVAFIRELHNLGIYDDSVFIANTNNDWTIGLFDAVLAIPVGAEYFIMTIMPPLKGTGNSETRGPIFNTGFTESHKYWIYE